MVETETPPAAWPWRLDEGMPAARAASIRTRAEALAAAAQYGWGHTIDFGSFTQPGLLGSAYLRIAGLLDAWNWWSRDLSGQAVADVGCFTGGLSLMLAARGARVVYAVDEVPEHIAQCAFLCDVFGVANVTTITRSLYTLTEAIEPDSLDLIVLSGVLYHLSDMLVGLYVLRTRLKPGGVLLIESNAVDDREQSYANFGRFYAGMWWQPSSACVKDMCDFMGFRDTEVRFYETERCLARCVRSEDDEIPYRRGLNWPFGNLRDGHERPLDPGVMAPVRLRDPGAGSAVMPGARRRDD